MPKTSKATATEGGEFGSVTDLSEQLDGYTVSFTSFHDDLDGTPLMKGLPNDQCQCPHWGYVLSGRVVFRYGDREEVYEPGDAFYTPPGHAPALHAAGSEFVMFSPTEELRVTEEVIKRNLASLQAG